MRLRENPVLEARNIGVRSCEIHARACGNPALLGRGRLFRFSDSLRFRPISMKSCAIVRNLPSGARESCAEGRRIGARVCEIHALARESSMEELEIGLRMCAIHVRARAVQVRACAIHVRVCENPASSGRNRRFQFPDSRKFRSGVLASRASVRGLCADARESRVDGREIGLRACEINVRLCGNLVSGRALLACEIHAMVCENHALLGKSRRCRFPDSREFRSVVLEYCASVRDLCADGRVS